MSVMTYYNTVIGSLHHNNVRREYYWYNPFLYTIQTLYFIEKYKILHY